MVYPLNGVDRHEDEGIKNELGGILMALVFEVSRKPQFRCEKCGVPFGAHTLTSRLFQILWAWFVISLAVGIIWVSLQH